MSFQITGTEELQKTLESLMGEGTQGKKIVRKMLRAGAKVVADRVKGSFPRKTGTAAGSVKVRAMKRSKGRVGVRVALFAESKQGFPYPMALEGGAKQQPPGVRVRKKVRTITVNGRSRRVTDEQASKAYQNLTWHVEPQHNVKNAFEASEGAAQSAMMATYQAELEKVSVK